MRLKQIKLIGFKSFVDPTVLSLEPQLIGIVGPNGCGKSNIIDAVRWVLGESSAKDLRGESMLDVIFNGSSERKPVGKASVELLFDNLAGKLNKEYANFSEVSIRREVYRDKQSEYYLNDKKCRKRDITDLFVGTGLLQNGYAIIGQGTISKIIESKPEDLRVFIEEAADISIYKRRRHETELRMGHTEENLQRLNDIILEQDRSLDKLAKQATIAKKYQNYQAQKHQIEANLLTIKATKFSADLQKLNKEIQVLSINLEKMITAKTKIATELEQYKLLHTEELDVVANIQEKYYQLNHKILQIEQTLEYKQEQQAKSKQELLIVTTELEKNSTEYNQDQKLQVQLVHDLTTIAIDYNNYASSKDNAEKIYITAQTEFQKIQTTVNNTQLALQQAHNRVDKTKISIEQIENLSKELMFRVDKLNQENISYDQHSLLTEILLLEEKLRDEEKLLHDQATELSLVVEQAKQKKLTIKQLTAAKSELEAKRHQLHGNIGSLQTLQNSALELNTFKISWLSKHNINQELLFFDQLQIADGWEIAVAVVLNQYLDAILIANDIKDFPIEVWDSIKDFRLTLIQETVLSLSSNISRSTIDDTPTASQLERSGLISIITKINRDHNILGWFNNFYIADDIEYAIANKHLLLPQECFVTKQGELVGIDWLIINRTDNKQNVLLRNKELKNLQANLQQITEELTNLNLQIDNVEAELLNIEQTQTALITNSKQQENSIRNIIAEVSMKKSKLDSIKIRSTKIILEIKEYNDKLAELTLKEQDFRANLAKEIEAIASLSGELQKLSDHKLQQQQDLVPLLETSQSLAKKFHETSLHQQQLLTKHQSIEEAQKRSLAQLKLLEAKKNKLQVELTNNFSTLQPLELELSGLLNDKLDQEELLHVTQNEISGMSNHINDLERQQQQLNSNIEQLKSNLENLKFEQQAVTIRLDDLIEVAKNNYKVNLEVTISSNNCKLIEEQTIPEEDLQVLQEKLDYLHKSINKLGPVNLAAVEEFEVETERKNYLNLQLQDLTTALATLKDAIAKIDTETRKKFKSTFEQINYNFQELFPKLFGGGGAYLELINHDLLASGVSLFAQPPGKKNSSIYLLSGGEKALTAVALVFAIFQLNPAPFCILDEVDAPLDDANVIRLGELLVKMSSKVQFVFITHNKATMKIANQLIGVTMKEPGVSRFVAVNVDEAVALID